MLLALGRAPEEVGERIAARGLEPEPLIAAIRETASCTSSSSRSRRRGRWRSLAQRRPADTDRALRQVAGEVRDRNCDLVQARVAEASASRATFASRDGSANIYGRPRDLVEEHARTLAGAISGSCARGAPRDRSLRRSPAQGPINAARVELVLEDLRLQRRVVLGHEHTVEASVRNLDFLLEAQDLCGVFGLALVVLLAVRQSDRRLGRDEYPRLRAVDSGLPRTGRRRDLGSRTPSCPRRSTRRFVRVLRVPVVRVLDALSVLMRGHGRP